MTGHDVPTGRAPVPPHASLARGMIRRMDDELWARQDEGVVVEELEDQLLLLRAGTSEVVHLDPVASRVWDLLTEPATERQLAVRVAEEFLVEADRVQDDLEPLLTLLRRQGLVVEVEGPREPGRA